MKNLIIFVAVLLLGCSKNEDVRYQVKYDRGVVCHDQIVNSVVGFEDLSSEIESELVQYINLEYGAPEFSKELEMSDLNYVGEFSACGKPIRFWSYPCVSQGRCHIAVQPWESSYYISMVSFSESEFK